MTGKNCVPEGFFPEETAADQVAGLVAGKVEKLSRAREFRFTPLQVRRARQGMEVRAQSGNWEGATGAMLVALYEWLHRHVYGVDAADLDPRGWAFATTMATRMVEKQFAGKWEDAVEFLSWIWKREEGREKWRRENERDGSRIGWRQQFGSAYLVVDFRISNARRHSR